MTPEEYAALDGLGLAEAIRKRQTTPLEAVDAAIAIVLNMGHEHHGRSPTRREDEAEGEDEAELQAALALSMVEGLPHAPERK